MRTPVRILIIVLVAFSAIAAFALKGKKASEEVPSDGSSSTTLSARAAESPQADTSINAKLPKLLDLGASKCVPCKMMKPILDDLKQNYSQAFITEFIAVWENLDAGKPYGIEAIPTQIFYDAEGKELDRHQGFLSKDDILEKWKELGITSPASAKS